MEGLVRLLCLLVVEVATLQLVNGQYWMTQYGRSGYDQMQPVAMPSYQPQAMPSYQPQPMPSYQPQSMPSYQPQAMPSYQPMSMPTYQPMSMPTYQPQQQSSYQPPAQKEKVYYPVYIRSPKKQKKKKKILSVQKGSFIPGGYQAFGKFKTLKGCQKACGQTPTCFAGDYNPWFKKCYFHGNITACASMQVHPSIIHFKKIPCTVPFSPRGLITVGALNTRGVLSKGVKSLQGCIKQCRNTIPLDITLANLVLQVCFAIDYNFATHKCYIHSDNGGNRICPAAAAGTIAPRDRIANAAVVNIAFCPA